MKRQGMISWLFGTTIIVLLTGCSQAEQSVVVSEPIESSLVQESAD